MPFQSITDSRLYQPDSKKASSNQMKLSPQQKIKEDFDSSFVHQYIVCDYLCHSWYWYYFICCSPSCLSNPSASVSIYNVMLVEMFHFVSWSVLGIVACVQYKKRNINNHGSSCKTFIKMSQYTGFHFLPETVSQVSVRNSWSGQCQKQLARSVSETVS